MEIDIKRSSDANKHLITSTLAYIIMGSVIQGYLESCILSNTVKRKQNELASFSSYYPYTFTLCTRVEIYLCNKCGGRRCQEGKI